MHRARRPPRRGGADSANPQPPAPSPHLQCSTRSSWPAGPARDSGRRAATTRRSSCCSSSAMRRCCARRSIGWAIGAERAADGRHEQAAGGGDARAVAGVAGGGGCRRAVQTRHGAVHRVGRAAGKPQRSGRDDGRDAGRPCDSAGGEVPGGDSAGGRHWSTRRRAGS